MSLELHGIARARHAAEADRGPVEMGIDVLEDAREAHELGLAVRQFASVGVWLPGAMVRQLVLDKLSSRAVHGVRFDAVLKGAHVRLEVLEDVFPVGMDGWGFIVSKRGLVE